MYNVLISGYLSTQNADRLSREKYNHFWKITLKSNNGIWDLGNCDKSNNYLSANVGLVRGYLASLFYLSKLWGIQSDCLYVKQNVDSTDLAEMKGFTLIESPCLYWCFPVTYTLLLIYCSGFELCLFLAEPLWITFVEVGSDDLQFGTPGVFSFGHCWGHTGSVPCGWLCLRPVRAIDKAVCGVYGPGKLIFSAIIFFHFDIGSTQLLYLAFLFYLLFCAAVPV